MGMLGLVGHRASLGAQKYRDCSNHWGCSRRLLGTFQDETVLLSVGSREGCDYRQRKAYTQGSRGQRRCGMQARRGGGLGEGMQGSGPKAFSSCRRAPICISEPRLQATFSAPAATFHCRRRENSKKRQLLLFKERLKLHPSASSQARPL